MENTLTSIQNNTELSMNVKIGLNMLVPQWCRTTLIIILSIVFITGLPGNALILYIQFKSKKKTSTDWFVTFMAVADILSLIGSVPMYTIRLVESLPIGSNFVCGFHQFVIYSSAMAQVCIIACIAVDRLWKTKSVQQLITPTRAFYCGITAFGFSVIVGTVASLPAKNNTLGQCASDPSKNVFRLVLLTIVSAVVVLSCCITVFSYIRIIMLLNARNQVIPMANSLRNRNGETAFTSFPAGRYGKALRTTKLMFLVTAVFYFSTVIPPIIGALLLSKAGYINNAHGTIFVFFLVRLHLINNCTNPYFYFWLNTAFREKMISIFKDKLLLC